VAARTAERDFVAMAAGALRQHAVAGARLEADHAVDFRMLAEHGLHASQIAELFLADVADKDQIADRSDLVLVEHLEPGQQHGLAARVVADAWCVELALARLHGDIGAFREYGVEVRRNQQPGAIANALANADNVALCVDMGVRQPERLEPRDEILSSRLFL